MTASASLYANSVARPSSTTQQLAEQLGVKLESDGLRRLFDSVNQDLGNARVGATAETGGTSRSFSVADALFMLHVARKEAVDQSLETALGGMKRKLDQQQALNQLVQGLGKDSADQKIRFAPDQIALLESAGFDLPRGDEAKAPIRRDDAGIYVPKDKLEDAKKELTQFITTLSSSNEIEMLSIQRLMNQANEASQAASALLKSGHDVAMSIIRNIS